MASPTAVNRASERTFQVRILVLELRGMDKSKSLGLTNKIKARGSNSRLGSPTN
jgi:hypothetical protein